MSKAARGQRAATSAGRQPGGLSQTRSLSPQARARQASSARAAERASSLAGRPAWRLATARSRSMPKASPAEFSVSMKPSEYSTSMSRGAIVKDVLA